MKTAHDQGWNLAGAFLCFATAYILSRKGCDPTVIGMCIGGGIQAVGAIGGMSRGSAASTTTTATTAPNKIETETKQ